MAVHMAMAQAVPPVQILCANTITKDSVTVTWTPAANNPCGPFVCYTIYYSNEHGGPFQDTVITSQAASSWLDAHATDSTFFYITDSFACPGATYQASDTIYNEANPAVPAIVSVSVQPDSSIIFTWAPSASPQTKFYLVYIVLPNGLISQPAIDTVYGRFNTTYRDTIRNPYLSNVTYTVDAYDSCGTNQPSGLNKLYQQSTLLSYTAPHCNVDITIQWTAYIGMVGGIAGYRVYVSRNDSAFAEVAALDTGVRTYQYSKFNDGDSLQIYVVAVSALDSTIQPASNYIRFTANVIKPPAFVYMTNLTVDTSNNAVDLTWIVDVNDKLLSYQIFNSPDSINYSSLGVQSVGPLPAPRFAYYEDSTATPQYGPYYYFVEGIDSCQTFSNSDTGDVISLQGNLSDYYQITLSWNTYQLYGATVLRYNLYRATGDGTGYHLINTFGPNVTSCIDSVFSQINAVGQFCYFVEADYTINLPAAGYSAALQTLSNITCVDHRPIIYIPNAFVYNGVNNFFKPRIIFGDPVEYSMTIWNRYGGKIFETNDPNGYWDGTYGGQPVEQGGYAYLITFTALDGTAIKREGIVIFLRK